MKRRVAKRQAVAHQRAFWRRLEAIGMVRVGSLTLEQRAAMGVLCVQRYAPNVKWVTGPAIPHGVAVAMLERERA